LETFKKVFKIKSGITVSTIHGIKGSEFDVVIAFALLEGMVPHSSDTQDSASRSLYVVSSRAKKNLHLISETGREDRWKRQNRTPTIRLVACEYNYD
jgi:superfamily I DNA/RNA helicase